MYTHHKFDHEFDGDFETTSSYLVCAVPRSGSSLLCELLMLTGLAGAPTEFFDPELREGFARVWGTETFDQYVEALLSRKTSPNGVFGMKAHYPQLAAALGDRDPNALLPELRFVYITREDRIAQAVSYSKALQTNLWAVDHPPQNGDPVFRAKEIRNLLATIGKHEDAWERFFERHDVKPLRVSYETLVERLEPTVRTVMDYIGVDVPDGFRLAAPTLQKQADGVSEEWARRFRLLEQAGG
jgi:trehalose 2-sulfotransferase